MKNRTKMMILSALFAALTAAGAFLKIPLGITSITLQTFFTAMAGVLLGAKWGAVSQAVYVGLGLIGLPVFTMGGGPGYLLQPSCGFLLGLIPMAWLIGRLTRRSASPARVLIACIAGEVLLYALALPYMYLVLNGYLGKEMPVGQLIRTGMLIYLPGDGIKVAVTVVLSQPLLRALRRLTPAENAA